MSSDSSPSGSNGKKLKVERGLTGPEARDAAARAGADNSDAPVSAGTAETLGMSRDLQGGDDEGAPSPLGKTLQEVSDAAGALRNAVNGGGTAAAPAATPATPATPAAAPGAAPASPAAAPKSYPETKNGWNYRTEVRADGKKDVYVEIKRRGKAPIERKVEPGGTFGFSGQSSPRHTWDGDGWIDPPPAQQNAAAVQRPAANTAPAAQQPAQGSAPAAPTPQEVRRLVDAKKDLHDRIDALRSGGVNETILNAMWGSVDALRTPGADSAEILRRAAFELSSLENRLANGTLGGLAAAAPGWNATTTPVAAAAGGTPGSAAIQRTGASLNVPLGGSGWGFNIPPAAPAQAAAATPQAPGGAPGALNAPLQSLTPAQIQQAIANGVQSALAQLGLQQPPPPGQPGAAPHQPTAPGGTPNVGIPTAAPAAGTFRATQTANGHAVQMGPAPGGASGFLVQTPQGWSHYPNQAAAQAAFQAAAAQAPLPGGPPQPAAQPPVAQPAVAPAVAPGALNAAPAAQQFLHQPLGSSPTPPAGYTPLPYANGGLSLGQDASGNFWVLHPSFGYYRYGTMQEAGAAMIYYANMAPAHTAAAQIQGGPGGTLQQAANAAPQAAQQATTRAMRSIRTILAQDRERLTGQHGRVLGFFRFLLRWEYGLTFAAGAGLGAAVGALTAASGGLGVAGAAKLGAGVSLVRSAMEARLARRILGEEAAREQAAGNTVRANEVLQERDNLRLLNRENVMSTVLVNGLIGAAGGAFGNWFLNQTSVGQSIKSGITSAGKWILGIANTPPAPAGAAAAAAAAVNNAPPPAPGANPGWAPTGNKLAAGATTINKLPGRAPGAGAAAFVNGPRRVPVAPYDVYVRGGSRVRTYVVDEAVRMRFKGKAGLQQFIDMFGYDPRLSKVAYVPRGPQSLYVEPAPQAGTRIFVQPPGGPKSMYVLPPEGVVPAPRLSTAPYVIGGEESVWSFAQQEMQKGVLSRAANVLPPNLHDSFINAMHDTLDKTPKFKSLLLGIPDAANMQWNKIPNGTKVDFAALLSNQEFLDEFRKTATSLRYGSLWRALTQNGNSPEKFFALVRSLYVPAPVRTGGIVA